MFENQAKDSSCAEAARARPWWLQVNGLPPKLAARREQVRAATANMTSAERSQFHADRAREWIANHWLLTLSALTLLSALQVWALYLDLTAGAHDQADAILTATNRLLQAGVLTLLWVRVSEARHLRR